MSDTYGQARRRDDYIPERDDPKPTPRDAGATGAYRIKGITNKDLCIVGPDGIVLYWDDDQIHERCDALNAAYLAGQAAQRVKDKELLEAEEDRYLRLGQVSQANALSLIRRAIESEAK